MWEPIPIDGLLGTVKAVAMPGVDARLHIWTDRGISAAFLDRKRKALRYHGYRFSLAHFMPAKGVFSWPATAPVIGECGADDRLYHADTCREHPSGLWLVDDADAQRLLVRDSAGEVVLTVAEHPVGTARWTAAGFSKCGRYLVVASLGKVRAFRFVPHGEKAIPVSHAAGGAADREALMAAILATPDDDTPRLVFADWLDEHGDPARAEFIRVQCRLAERMRTEAVADDDSEAARSAELEATHGARWQAELGTIRGVDWKDFRRGFPGVRVLSAVTLVRTAKRIFAAAPVDRVEIMFPEYLAIKSLAKSPAFGRVRDLSFSNLSWNGNDDSRVLLRQMLASPLAAGLRVLRILVHSPISVTVEIEQSPNLANLEGIDFSRHTVTESDARILLRAGNLPKLAWFTCEKLACTTETRAWLRKRFPGMKL
jgi:uncharacterized protein (TIGR02996 family)